MTVRHRLTEARGLHREPGASRRQADAAAGRLDHVIAGHLHDVCAPVELLLLVFEKIAAGESVTVGFDIAPAGIAGNRRVAPAEFPAGMLGADAPALEAYRECA